MKATVEIVNISPREAHEYLNSLHNRQRTVRQGHVEILFVSGQPSGVPATSWTSGEDKG